jgi:gliding motility-associated-like protein
MKATVPEKAQWDGKLGGKLMPSNDYWYILRINEIGKEYIGHFTLMY